jgi:hypothetical protein
LYTNVIRPKKFDLFIIFCHGLLIPDSEARRVSTSMVVPENTLVIQTGGGGTIGCATSVSMDSAILSMFNLHDIATTLGVFTGHHGDRESDLYRTFLYNVPTERALNKRIQINADDYNDPSGMTGRWGVFKVSFPTSKNITLTEIPSYTNILREAGRSVYTQADFIRDVSYSSRTAEDNTNIFVFVNCISAHRYFNPIDYRGSLELAGINTHFGIGPSRDILPPPSRPVPSSGFADPANSRAYPQEALFGAINRRLGLRSNRRNEVPLPAGWDMDYAGRDNRPYFFYRSNGFSTWFDPRIRMDPNFNPSITYWDIGSRGTPPPPPDSELGICDCITQMCLSCFSEIKSLLKMDGGSRRNRRQRRRSTRRLRRRN